MKLPAKMFLSLCLLISGYAIEPMSTKKVNRPFPQHLTYGKDKILPDNHTRTEMDGHVGKFYDYWKKEYLVYSKKGFEENPLYRIAFGHPNEESYTVTVSEGQGFGMIIMALMAGYDPDAKAIFDGLFRFVKQHPSKIDARLMAWKVTEDSNQSEDSAFDGDADIAYALLLASQQWGDGGVVNYTQEAKSIVDATYESVVGDTSKLPMLGDWVDPDGAVYNEYTNRTSDFMLANFSAYSRILNDERWNPVIYRSITISQYLQKNYSQKTGLLPDFIIPISRNDFLPKPAREDFLEGPDDGAYFYNACRTPLRIGLDALLNHHSGSLAIVRKMSHWIEMKSRGNPSNIHAGYTLEGETLKERAYFSTVFAAPFGVAAMNDKSQQVWLNAIYDAVKSQHEGYYEDTVNLLSLLIMSGNYWD